MFMLGGPHVSGVRGTISVRLPALDAPKSVSLVGFNQGEEG